MQQASYTHESISLTILLLVVASCARAFVVAGSYILYTLHTEGFVLVYWPDEECMSVVASSRVTGSHEVGDECTVTMQRKTYSGRIAATGMYVCVNLFIIIKKNCANACLISLHLH